MTSTEWDVPIDPKVMARGKFSKVRMDSNNVYILNGKAIISFVHKPMSESAEQDLHDEFIRNGYAEADANWLSRRIINVIKEHVKTQQQQQYESGEGSVEDAKLKPLYLMKYTKGIPYGIPAAESIILGG